MRMVPPLALEPLHDAHEFRRELRIQVCGGFVGDDHRRVVDQCPGDGHPLRFAPGEPFHFRVGFPRQFKEVQEAQCAPLQRRPSLARRVGGQHDVFQGGEALDEIELLEYETEGAAPDFREKPLGQAGDFPAVEGDSSRGGSGHASQNAQKSCLPRAAGTFEGRHSARFDLQGNFIQCDEFVWLSSVEYFFSLDSVQSSPPHVLTTESGSMVAARHDGHDGRHGIGNDRKGKQRGHLVGADEGG